MSIATEQALIAALKTALAGESDVVWGFLEMESALTPPSLPLVCVTRVNAALMGGTGLQDLCDPDDDTATIVIQIDAWDKVYEDARMLNEAVHAAVEALDGWAWQSEVDVREPQFKGWRVSSNWTINGER